MRIGYCRDFDVLKRDTYIRVLYISLSACMSVYKFSKLFILCNCKCQSCERITGKCNFVYNPFPRRLNVCHFVKKLLYHQKKKVNANFLFKVATEWRCRNLCYILISFLTYPSGQKFSLYIFMLTTHV